MEHNRNNQNHPYRRGNRRNPGAPRGSGNNFKPRKGNRGNQNKRFRGSSSRGNYSNFNQRNQKPGLNVQERTFDERGREIGKIGNPSTSFSYYNQQNVNYSNNGEQGQRGEERLETVLNSLEGKARNFLHIVLGQPGIRSKLIFLEGEKNPLQTLQGTVVYCQLQMNVEQNNTGEFVMKIGQEELARGTFPNKQTAKNALAEQALEMLKKDCFYIVKKRVYEEVNTKKSKPKEEAKSQMDFQGSKAHQMMLKMGWGGKGLGVNEQGEEKTVAETLDQNVSRQGLGGTNDVFKKIHELLEDYLNSDKMSLLRFDPNFTPEERAHIHQIAAKLGLKSKSEGNRARRRITITKRLQRSDLVYNLLTCSNLENALYKLIIPSNFVHLWNVYDNY